MSHQSHTMHDNSLVAFRSLDTQARRRRILMVYAEKGKPLTDRDVMLALGFYDPNTTRPRITEMVGDGTLVEVGSAKDTETNRSVRTCTLANPFQATIGDIL